MATRYWVGGAGTWDASTTTHWAASSGGAGGQSVPGTGDDVVFDGESNAPGDGNYTVTLSGTTLNTRNLTFGNPSGGVLKVTGASGNNLKIYGNLVYGSGVLSSNYVKHNFSATSGTQTITTNSVVICGGFTFNNSGGTVQLADNLKMSYGLTPSIYLQSGAFDANGKNVEFSCNYSIRFQGALSFYNLTFNMLGSLNCEALLYDNITVTNVLTVNGVSRANRVIVRSAYPGTRKTITSASNSISYADFYSITGAGAGSWDLSGATSVGDGGDNSGITFATPVDRYWVATSGGNFNATTSWSTTDGGGSGASVPLIHDIVHFTSGSITSSGRTIALNCSNLPGMDFSSIANSPTVSTSTVVYFFGSMNFTGLGAISISTPFYFKGGSSNYNFNSGGFTFPTIGFGVSTGLILTNNLISTGTIYTGGVFIDLNDYNLTCKTTYGQSEEVALSVSIYLGNGTITYTGFTADTTAYFNSGAPPMFNLYAEGSTIKVLQNVETYKFTFSGRGKTYNNFWITGLANYEVDIVGSNTFNDFKIDNLPKTLKITAGTTQHVTTFTTPQARYFPATTNLEGLWNLDTDANDDSGNGYNGTVSGAIYGVGVASGDLLFDGSDDYADMGALSGFDFDSDFSLSFWVKGGYKENCGVITKTNSGTYYTAKGISITHISNPYHLYLWIGDGTNHIYKELITCGSSPATPTPYGWTHIVISRSGNTITCYVNGESIGTLDVTGYTDMNGSQNMLFGKGNGGYWQGELDEVRLYSVALSADEAAALYNNPTGATLTIGSITTSGHTLTKDGGGTITIDHASISRSAATPANTWYAGHTSTDGDNNSGWQFGDFQSRTNDTETVTHTDTKITLKSSVKTLVETVTHTDIFSKLWTLAERVLTETVGFFDQVTKGATDHLNKAGRLFYEDFEGGKVLDIQYLMYEESEGQWTNTYATSFALRGFYGSADYSETIRTIDTTGKIEGQNSLKFAFNGGKAGSGLCGTQLEKRLATPVDEVFYQFSFKLSADFDPADENVVYFGSAVTEGENWQFYAQVVKTEGAFYLGFSNNFALATEGVEISLDTVYRIEAWIKKGVYNEGTENYEGGRIKVWINNNDESNPDYDISEDNITGDGDILFFVPVLEYSNAFDGSIYFDRAIADMAFIGAGKTFWQQIFTETITFTVTFLKGSERLLTETATFTASILKSGIKTLVETVTHSPSLEALRAIFKTLTEVLTHTDTATRGETRTMGEITTHTDSVNRTATRNLLETVTYTPAMIRAAVRVLTEAVSHTAVATWLRHTTKTLTETIAHTATTLRGVSRLISEEVAHSSALDKKTTRTATETATHTDDLTKLRTAYKVLADTITLTALLVKATSRVLTEIITHSDTWRAWRNGIRAGIWTIRAKVVTAWTHAAKIATTWTQKAKVTTPWTKKPKP